VLAVQAEQPLPTQFELIASRGTLGKLVPCRHFLFQGASAEEVNDLEAELGTRLPKSLRSLLTVSNGAHLFCLEYEGGPLGPYLLPKYRLLTIEEIAFTQRDLFSTYASYLSDDLEQTLLKAQRLDYIAFCDLGDGDYLASRIGENEKEIVFLLDHDYGYFPYSNVRDPEYEIIADSLEEWLSILLNSFGRDGTGRRYYPV